MLERDIVALLKAANSESVLREAIRRQGLDVRRVRLRESRWWKHGVLPVIAFESAGGRPVALIPASFGGYWRLDAGGARTPLGDAARRLLDPEAFMLYERIPAKIRSIPGLVRHALSQEKPATAFLAATAVCSAAAIAGLLYLPASFAAACVAVALFQLIRSLAACRLTAKLRVALVPGIQGRVLRAGLSYFHSVASDEVSLAGGLAHRLCGAIASDAAEFSVAAPACLGVSFAMGAITGLAALALALARLALRYLETASLESCVLAEQRNAELLMTMLRDVLKLRPSGAAGRIASRYLTALRDIATRRSRGASFDVCRRTVAAITPAILLLTVARPGFAAIAGAALLAWCLHTMDESSGGLFFLTHGVARLKPLLAADHEPEVPEKRGLRLAGAIRLDNVGFDWPGAREPALEGISLAIEPGQFVCLAGPSGSGKSTLIRLLLGLETPSRGEILYDGAPLPTLDIESVRSQIEFISQEERLSEVSIRANIQGASQLGVDDAWAAAHIACLDDTIRAMPMGMMTFASENVLSGGERQRVFIARAVIRRPAVLILDETLSALDEETQARVIANLRTLPGMTCIVASHRPGLAAAMDRTVRLDRGRIVAIEKSNPEKGNPAPAPSAPQPLPPPSEPTLYRREAVERFHLAEPLDRIIRL